jgi:putative flippase GtrA
MRRLLATSPRYLAVSGGCFLTSNGLLLGMAAAQIHYVWAVVISNLVMTPLSYLLHLRFTYRVAARPASFWRYALAQAVNMPGNWLLYWIFVTRLGLGMAAATPLVTGTMFLWNFTSSFWAIVLRRRA